MTHCHVTSYSGHASTSKTVAKILNDGLYWPNIIKDAHSFLKKCDQCQHTKNILKRNEMHLNNILQMEIFYVWGIDFMVPFISSLGNQYIIISIDYVQKWIEIIVSPTNDTRVVIKLFKKTIFTGFCVPRLVISDGRSHFIVRQFKSLLKK